jgi:hypothetical protein
MSHSTTAGHITGLLYMHSTPFTTTQPTHTTTLFYIHSTSHATTPGHTATLFYIHSTQHTTTARPHHYCTLRPQQGTHLHSQATPLLCSTSTARHTPQQPGQLHYCTLHTQHTTQHHSQATLQLCSSSTIRHTPRQNQATLLL